MKKIICIFISALVAVLFLTGCTVSTKKQPQQPVQQPQVQQEQVQHQQVSESVQKDDDAVHVSSVKELLEAIKPEADIVLNNGYYNISEYIQTLQKDSGGTIDSINKYVKLVECYDGTEIVIERADGLTIRGEEHAEIVTEPRYAAVMNFNDCRDIKLSSLTIGHTQAGDCSGNVIDFTNCQNISLKNMDIYGCGVYGIGAYNGTENVSVYNSIIHDCYYGPFEIEGCNGKFEFHDTVFKNNTGYCYIEFGPEITVAFYRCDFGKKETEYFMMYNDVYIEDCNFSKDIEVYPDFSERTEYDCELSDFENMEIVPFDEQVVENTDWIGSYVVIPETGGSFYLPVIDENGKESNIAVRINADKTGILDYYGSLFNFSWYCDSDYTMCFDLDDGTQSNAIMHAERVEGERPLWLLVNVGETAIWMHINE